MNIKKTTHITGSLMGLVALIFLWNLAGWEIAVCIFFLIFGNNLTNQ